MKLAKYKGQIDAAYARARIDYNPDTGLFVWKKRPLEDFQDAIRWKQWNTRFAGMEAFSTICGAGDQKRLQGRLDSFLISAHVMAWLLYYGKWPRLELDHCNGNPMDNRIENLREVTRLENCQNRARSKTNTSGQNGVSWSRSQKRWIAYINVYGKRVHLGSFSSFDDAVYVRLRADKQHEFHPNHGREPKDHRQAVAEIVRERIRLIHQGAAA